MGSIYYIHLLFIYNLNMLSRTPLTKVANLLTQSYQRFAFKKFDYEDGLNLKSLLNEEEIMVNNC